ncbi:MAG: TlpA family protein disulfide reductase [Betaproteobacteria bacterium]|nr:TlpA family protein disulfide reductase [Betaproteobacteria bacterium]
MKTMKFPIRQVGLIVVAAAIAVAAYFALWQVPEAPQVQFRTLAGEKIMTSDLRGKVVLVNFWATSCVTCMAEMPKIVETYKKYKGQGFETVAVAMDYDPPNYVLAYAQQKQLPFRVALDVDGSVARGFGNVRLTPTTFIIDKRGRVIKQFLGEPDFAQLHALLEARLKDAV